MYIVLPVKYPLFLSDLNGTLIFTKEKKKKYSNIEYRENPFSGSRLVPFGRTDRYDEANSRFSQFYERA
jgi:hypothetical protein